jgi:hypothetical protein
MDRVGPREIHRILGVTDSLHLHRESVSVTLATRGEGNVRLLGERIEIVAPAAGDFEAWLQNLPARIRALDLTRVRRSE